MKVLEQYRVGIAGCGGIGSNVARNLVQVGVKKFHLVDFDVVEYSNLNRQFFTQAQIGLLKSECLKENLLSIYPDLDIILENKKLESDNMLETFEHCEIVIEAFDGLDYKKKFMEAFASLTNDKKLILAISGIASCNLENIKSRKLGGIYLLGDFSSDVKDHVLYAPKINIITSMAADIILKKGFSYEGI